MQEADIIINNNQDFASGLDVLSGFLRNKLDKKIVNDEL
jgi:hypothetical protein